MSLRDDLGHPVPLDRPPRRVISLVPSLTESLAGAGILVGATDWCTHPADLDVPRVRGTKNPDLAAVRALEPDLVVANKEENRELDVRRLRDSGVAVWVTDVETVPQALDSLDQLFTGVLERSRPDWLVAARELWDGDVPRSLHRVAVPVWRDPWMVVGGRTFTGDLLVRLGYGNAFDGRDSRYPHVGVDEIAAARVDLVVLPDEPYRFHAGDGPEAFPGLPCALVSGRLLTWYGPSLVEAARVVPGQLAAALRDNSA